jgi:hypothetical protein
LFRGTHRTLTIRHTVREEVRRDLGNAGGAIEVEVETRLGSG